MTKRSLDVDDPLVAEVNAQIDVDTKKPKNATKKCINCHECGKTAEHVTQCSSCSSAFWFCDPCFLPCAVCKDKHSCPECRAHCSYCELDFCGSDKCRKILNCGYCESDICEECTEAKICLKCKRLCCEECAPAFTEGCDMCGMSEHCAHCCPADGGDEGDEGDNDEENP